MAGAIDASNGSPDAAMICPRPWSGGRGDPPLRGSREMPLKEIVIAAYALMIIGIGVVGLRKTRSFSDFFLGGGKIGPWMTAFTYAASYFSAVLFIGFAGKIGWGFGYSGLWIAVSNALVGVLAVWWVAGPPGQADGAHLQRPYDAGVFRAALQQPFPEAVQCSGRVRVLRAVFVGRVHGPVVSVRVELRHSVQLTPWWASGCSPRST